MPTTETQERRGTGLTTVDGRTFPLVRVRLQTRAEGGIAYSTLIQDYLNPHQEPLEVIYSMPLPADGSVLGYTIRLGERVVRGEIETREHAREQYCTALEQGRTAGLLEQERADTFTQTLGNLPPGAQVRVRIEVLQPLAFERRDGERAPSWVYRFPTVVGVRYKGAEGRVPDAEKLDTPRADGEGTPVRLELGMVIADGGPEATAPRSASHPLSVAGSSEGTRVYTAEGARLDRDLVVGWNAASETVSAGLVEGRGLDGDDGRYALLTVTPPAVAAQTFPRDLTVLIDASGSMGGAPLEQAKQVVRSAIDSLTEGDRFELAAFASSPRSLTPGPVPVSSPEQVAAALEALASLQAGGATEMRHAIVDALDPLRPGSQRQIVLLTDGFIDFEHEVIGEVLNKLPAGTRLHTVGIGSAPNRSLTCGLARAGRGVEILVGHRTNVAGSARSLLRATAKPVLTDVTIGGSAVIRVAPERSRDVFAGQPLVSALELKPEGGSVEVSAKLAGHVEPWTQRFDVAANGMRANAEALPLGALYGRERVADGEMKQATAQPGVAAERAASAIRNLGLRHRIVTRETSLIAISEDRTVDPTDPRRRERLAVEMPHEVSAEGVGLARTGNIRYRVGGVMDLISLAGAEVPQAPRSLSPATIAARVVRRADDLLVIEFESPGPELPVPGETDPVLIEDGLGHKDESRVDASASTRPGLHGPGVTIRLVLRPSARWRSTFRKSIRRDPRKVCWSIDGETYEVGIRVEPGEVG